MQDIFGQVHWRTLIIFNDKKAPEFCNAGAFSLANYLIGQAPVAHSASVISSKLLVLLRSTSASVLTYSR